MPDSASARALVLERPRRLIVHDIPLPAVDEDDALVRVEACGLCGTDHEQYTGEFAGGSHSFPGTRRSASSRRSDRGHPRGGEWLRAIGWRWRFPSCRDCKACVGGEYRRCERHGLADMYGFISVERAPGLWGGYAEYQYLAPDSMLLPVPKALDPVVATVFNPLGAGIRWGATIPGTGPGDVVAVLGPGIRGLCVAAAAKDAGAEFVMMTGLGARDADRLALASLFGADLAVDVAVDDPVAALRDATGGLADVVVDVTAKAPAAFAQAIELARPAGTVVVAGTRGWDTEAPGFSPTWWC